MENPLIIQFDLNQKLFNNVLEGFTDEESNRRLHGDKNMNHVKYLAGHLLVALQYGFAKLAGIEREVKWNDLFAVAGQSEAKDDIEYPTLEEIKTEWNELYKPVRKGLEGLTPEILNKKPPIKFWETGQIGILRRGFGKEAMRYD